MAAAFARQHVHGIVGSMPVELSRLCIEVCQFSGSKPHRFPAFQHRELAQTHREVLSRRQRVSFQTNVYAIVEIFVVRSRAISASSLLVTTRFTREPQQSDSSASLNELVRGNQTHRSRLVTSLRAAETKEHCSPQLVAGRRTRGHH